MKRMKRGFDYCNRIKYHLASKVYNISFCNQARETILCHMIAPIEVHLPLGPLFLCHATAIDKMRCVVEYLVKSAQSQHR